MAWIAPKLDWLPTESINADDWNRIENNTREVADFLNSIQYVMPTMTYITNRTQTSIVYLRDINRIEQNLEAIRNAFITPNGYPGSKSWVSNKPFTNEDAIRLEQNVALLMEYGLLVTDSKIFCCAWTVGMEMGMI